WGSRSVGRSAGIVLTNHEAQFCTYPELIWLSQGEKLPFQYFRLDAFEAFGDPDVMMRRINSVSIKSSIDRTLAERIFGLAVNFETATKSLDKVKDEILLLRSGDFRILTDPGNQWGPCKHCSYTQICRRTHTETLLRAKRADQP